MGRRPRGRKGVGGMMKGCPAGVDRGEAVRVAVLRPEEAGERYVRGRSELRTNSLKFTAGDGLSVLFGPASAVLIWRGLGTVLRPTAAGVLGGATGLGMTAEWSMMSGNRTCSTRGPRCR